MSAELQHNHLGDGEAISPALQGEIYILLMGIDTVHLSLEQEILEDMYHRLFWKNSNAHAIFAKSGMPDMSRHGSMPGCVQGG